MPELKTEAEAVADLIRGSTQTEIITVKSPEGDRTAQVLAVPTNGGGVKIQGVKEILDAYLTQPERRKGVARFTDLKSFIAHANRFKDGDSVIFGNDDPTAPSLTCVLDYHRAGGDGDPRFGEHGGHYPFPLSVEWKEWQGSDKRSMTQAAFAHFLESRIVDVVDPTDAGDAAKEYAGTLGCTYASAAKLLELSRGLVVRESSKVRQAISLGTGESSFAFESTHQDESGAPLKVPGAFLIAIPFFRNGFGYQLPVRLRYRLKDGAVTWFYELARVDVSFQNAFNEAADKAKAETELPFFLGSPE